MLATLDFEVEDMTGQVRRRVRSVPRDITVGDFVSASTRQLGQPDVDASGRPLQYGARSSDGEVLNSSDLIGDVVEPDTLITITKSVTAGGLMHHE